MNSKHLNVRMDRHTGEMFLTEEKFRKPIRKICSLNQAIMGCLCTDLYHENGTKEVTRDVKFADGTRARIIIRDVTNEPDDSPDPGTEDS